jgi:hypothetical protein
MCNHRHATYSLGLLSKAVHDAAQLQQASRLSLPLMMQIIGVLHSSSRILVTVCYA